MPVSPSAPSIPLIPSALGALVENFSLLEDWEDRYRYLIDLGRALPQMPDSLKTEDTCVPGCVSHVWMVTDTDSGGIFHMTAASDSEIVQGLIALLMAAYDGQPATQISAIDIHGAFEKMGLHQNLSPNRRNGFHAMTRRIQQNGIPAA